MELEVNFYKPYMRTHYSRHEFKCKGVEGNSCMGSDILTKRKYGKEKLLTVLLVLLLHLRGGRMTGSVGSSSVCSHQGNQLFFRCSDAGCVYTPSKNVKNTKEEKFYYNFVSNRAV